MTLFIIEPPDPLTDQEAMRLGLCAVVDTLECMGILPYEGYSGIADYNDDFDPFLDADDLP